MRLLICVLLALASITCRQKDNFIPVPDQHGGFVEMTANGKSLDDPACPICPKDVASLKLVCYARQEADTTIQALNGVFRYIWIDLYDNTGDDVGQVYFRVSNFNPGRKQLMQDAPPLWNSMTTYIDYWDWDTPLGVFDFDSTQPYTLVIDKYDAVEQYVEGRFDVGYSSADVSIPMRSNPSTVRLAGRFKAKIRLVKEGEFIE
ncbi:hypothetical protein J2I47_02380 [Fibrella sp. HMF5335]|uniref:Uncharacterized protein n=1 Tax=Fibrella rubiginis TaxID=2817060 RepID=A0A939GF40_9BACT|nr:hypothetical protein [Fibrella rubiginis]MBO0935387.1 hypothetical protein [Fibrella rubiginis]